MPRALLPVMFALGLASPALGQTLSETARAGSAGDPWAGLVIVVTPPTPDTGGTEPLPPDERGQTLGLAEEPAPAAAEESAASPEVAADEEQATDEMPSLWSSLDAGIGDTPTDVGEPTPVARVIAAQPAKTAKPAPLPTSLDLRHGPAQFEIVTSVATSAPVSSATETSAGGGNGEVKGRVGYSFDNLSLYGVGGVGAAESTGAVSVYDSLAIGGSYSMPLAPLGLRTESVGAKVEVADKQAVTTSVEVRSDDGPLQRFISIERATTPATTASDTVRAGMVGKF